MLKHLQIKRKDFQKPVYNQIVRTNRSVAKTTD